MEEMIVKGYWWIPSKPEESIAGVLTYNGKDRSTLELFGCFTSFNSQHYRKFDPNACELILGVTQRGEKYSLLNNIRSLFQLPHTKYAHSRLILSLRAFMFQI